MSAAVIHPKYAPDDARMEPEAERVRSDDTVEVGQERVAGTWYVTLSVGTGLKFWLAPGMASALAARLAQAGHETMKKEKK